MLLPHTTEGYSSFVGNRTFIPFYHLRKNIPVYFALCEETYHNAAIASSMSTSDQSPEPEDLDAPLEDAARAEREYVRQRLREELNRQPTEEEVDEWLRQHTEGY
jgi:hypothetical protein